MGTKTIIWSCFVIFLIPFFTLFSFGQTQPRNKADTFLKKLSFAKNDSTKILLLSALVEYYFEATEPGMAKKYITQETTIANRSNWARGKAIVTYDAAYHNYYESSFEKALSGFEQARQMAETVHDVVLRYKALVGVAGAQFYLERYDESLQNTQEALAYYKKTNNVKLQLKQLDMIAYIAQQKKDYDQAFHYFHQSLQLAKSKGDVSQVIDSELNLLYLFGTYKKDIPKAMVYGNDAIARTKNSANTKLYGYVLQSIAQIYFNAAKYNEVLDFYLRYSKLAERTGDKTALIGISSALGNVYQRINDHPKALIYLKRTFELSGGTQSKYGKDYLHTMYSSLANAYYNLNDYDNKLIYDKLALALNTEGATRVGDLNRIAWTYFKKKQYDLAYRYANEGLELSEKVKNTNASLISTMGSIIREAPDSILLENGIVPEQRFQKSLNYFERSMAVKIKNGRNASLRSEYEEMSLTYEKMGRYNEAFESYKKFITLRDSLDKASKAAEVQQRIAAFGFSKTEDSLKYQQRLTNEKLARQTLLAREQEQSLTIKQQQLTLSGRQQQLAHLQYLKTQASLNASQKEQALAQATVGLQKAEISAKKLQSYFFAGGIVALLALSVFIWRNYHNQRISNELLATANEKINRANHDLNEQREEITAQRDQLSETLNNLKTAQRQLIQSEKMASLGELTAGIAHEIQNPLNFVNNFSDVNREMVIDLKEALKAGDMEEALAIADDLGQNEEKIHYHGKRADSIVKGMLEHSRVSSGKKEATDLNKLTDEYLRLAYHGLRAKDKEFNVELITQYEPDLPKIKVNPQDIGRVLLNIFNNAFYAVKEKQTLVITEYRSTVETTTFKHPLGGIGIKIRDNGTGIPENIREKIMQPFFTTKPTGQGTGLGLSLSYDIIVKSHDGQITVESKAGEGSEFVIYLPS